MHRDRPPEPRSNGSSPTRPPYVGLYDRPADGRLVRRTDGLILQRCPSKGKGCTEYYLFDVTHRRFLSGLFLDNRYPEFDADDIRYALVQLTPDVYEIRFLRVKGVRGAA